MPISQQTSNFDEISMKQSLIFSDCLKDLKNLRAQLYSAAEYFELSYMNDDQKQIVVETLKDYAVKALVNTVDHLGSVAFKVNDLLDEKVDDVSGTEFRVSCIEQRLRTCQQYIDHEGHSQQSLVMNTPKYHKRYILPVGETMNGGIQTRSKYEGCNLDDEDDWHQFRNAVRATIRETPPSIISKENSPVRSQRPSPSPQPRTFSFTSTMSKKELGSYALNSSPLAALLPKTQSSSRSTTPNSSRPTTPSNSNGQRRYPSEPRKSASMRMPAERDNSKDVEQYPSKSKRLLKALLSRRKSKKDDMLYTYLDEY
ncbi:Protein ABIL2, partial [Cucurbita argyrosperma subsp. sororia]